MLDQQARRRLGERAEAMRAELAGHGVTMVGLTCVDNAGITRTKAVPLSRLTHAARWGVGMSPCFDGFSARSVPVPSAHSPGVVGDIRLHPDLDRLSTFAAAPGWAWAPADRLRQDGTPHPGDQRTLTTSAVSALETAGLRARMAFEIEWIIGTPAQDGSFTPAAGGQPYGFGRLTERAEYLAEIVACLGAQGIEVDQVHPEYAAAQFELSIAAADPVRAADEYVLVRETIRAVSFEHGCRASFAPSVLAGAAGNGLHVHLSIWSGQRNLIDAGPGDTGGSFAAGILDRLPALLAIGAPAAASYLRLVPRHWSAPYRCWGTENREAALRWIQGVDGERDSAANIEVKCFDSAANPYLLAAGLLFAGLAGYREGARLPEEITVDPASLDADRGAERLPTSLAEATTAFEADPVLCRAFGTELSGLIADLRREEHAHFAGADPEQVVAESRWLY
ncbi:glutamine synthetase family protein [Sciscionella sediminilitoris]|uniref:glutamine synthetase family protein n=1 Tax=Sciscionella sediminilitoris TaxID=1445613 RepID=UPI0004DEE5EC|nr:glutamine synthetase family protein [Sciscionella sp. SE31]